MNVPLPLGSHDKFFQNHTRNKTTLYLHVYETIHTSHHGQTDLNKKSGVMHQTLISFI